MPSASPFRIVNRYLPLHVESSQLQEQLTRIPVDLHFHCQPLLTVTYSSYLTQDTLLTPVEQKFLLPLTIE